MTKTLSLGLVFGAWLGLQGTAFADGTPTLKFYGFLKPSLAAASSAVDTFGHTHLGAFTAAANPALTVQPNAARSTFQVAQSRAGVTIAPTSELLGRLEVDFFDSSKASPTTTAVPRLRRATVSYQKDNFTFLFGQDWDLVSPLGPHGYNLVGHYFQSGDIGFMRLQLQGHLQSGPWEHSVAFGFPNSNTGGSDGISELGGLPTVALRETYTTESVRIGFSAIAGAPRLSLTRSDRVLAGAATVFLEWKGGDIQWRSEAYLGRNVNQLGLLGLGTATPGATHLNEWGVYSTARLALDSDWHLFGGFGVAALQDPSQAPAAYSLTAPNTRTSTGATGITNNLTLRSGVDYTLARGVQLFGELSFLATRHQLDPQDASLGPSRHAVVTEVGALLEF